MTAKSIFLYSLRSLRLCAKQENISRRDAENAESFFIVRIIFSFFIFNAEVAEGRKERGNFLKFVFRLFRVFRLSALKNKNFAFSASPRATKKYFA
jgi:hypothetical protein